MVQFLQIRCEHSRMSPHNQQLTTSAVTQKSSSALRTYWHVIGGEGALYGPESVVGWKGHSRGVHFDRVLLLMAGN